MSVNKGLKVYLDAFPIDKRPLTKSFFKINSK